jgi:hypothetical protein
LGASVNNRCASSKKKTSLGLSRSPGQLLEHVRQQPQQERRIEARVGHQLVGGEDVDVAAAVAVRLHEVFDVERGLAEELRGALVLQDQELALHRSHRRLRHVAVARADRLGVVGRRNVGQHLAEVLDVDEALVHRIGLAELVVGIAEHDVDDAFLHIVEVQDARQQKRAHLEHGGADRMALLAEQIPEHGREFVGFIFEADILGALDESVLGLAGRRDPGEVALDVGGEHRHAGAGKAFRHGLQRHGLAGPGGAGHEPVAIAEGERQHFGLVALADEYFSIPIGTSHHVLLRSPRRLRRTPPNTFPS